MSISKPLIVSLFGLGLSAASLGIQFAVPHVNRARAEAAVATWGDAIHCWKAQDGGGIGCVVAGHPKIG